MAKKGELEKDGEEDEAKDTQLGCCPQHPRFDGLVRDFLKESTLHGVKYLGMPGLHYSERIFWGIAVMCSIGYSIYLVMQVYSKYDKSPVIISFQPKETSIAQIPFPAITICNANIFKRKQIRELYDHTAKLLLNTTKMSEWGPEIFEHGALLDHVSHHCLAAPSFLRRAGQLLYDLDGKPDFINLLEGLLKSLNDTEILKIQEMGDKIREKVFDIIESASHDCDDMILKCIWARKVVPCKDFIFDIETRNGHCCVFNMMPKYILHNMDASDDEVIREKKNLPPEAQKQWEEFKEEDYIQDLEKNSNQIKYPKRQSAGGKAYGLSILINPELEEYSTCSSSDGWGFTMTAHSPLSFPNVVDNGMAIPPNSEVFVDIEPQVTIAESGELRSIPIRKRGCLLPTDKDSELYNYKIYSSTNCMDECVAEETLRKCSCVRFYMPRNDSGQLCGPKKRECAENVTKDITAEGKKGPCAKCIPACTEIKYNMQTSHFPLRKNDSSPFLYQFSGDNGTEVTKRASNYSILHIYFGTDSLYAKERKTLYTASDLLANAGGLLSLTIGFSIISLVEIIYFFVIRAFFLFRSARKEKQDGDNGRRGSNSSRRKLRMSPRSSVGAVDIDSKGQQVTGYYNWAIKSSSRFSATGTLQQRHKRKKDDWTGNVNGNNGTSNFQILSGSNSQGHQQVYPYNS